MIDSAVTSERPRPLLLIAELTHRCPLACPYCSNPLTLELRENELDLATWARVFGEAAALGVQRVDLSGGEPGARRDLPEITASAREAGLGTTLVTSGVAIATRTIRDLWEAGLERVQISFQDSDAVSSDRIAGHRGAFARKCALAAEVGRLGLPLTIEFVVHRANIERIGAMVELALDLKAHRVAIAHVQSLGWATKNRDALLLDTDRVRRARDEIESLRARHRDIDIKIATAGVDRSITVTPSGKVLPGAALTVKPDVEFWNVRGHSLREIWRASPAFNALGNNALPPDGAALVKRAAALPDAPVDTAYEYRRM